MKKKYIYLIVVLLLSPILVNYTLLSWRAPGVIGDSEAWIGFFANFLGLIGAVIIAVYQWNKQKEKDEKQDRENNRSYIDVQDFNATMMLVGVRTHENSRLMRTMGYESLKKRISEDQWRMTKVPYLKISHYGNPPVIIDCNIILDIKFERMRKEQSENINMQIGAIEQGIEVFVPLTPENADQGTKLDINILRFEYTTLKGERLRYTRDYKSNTETLESLISDSITEQIYSINLKSSYCFYPNKIDHLLFKK